MPESDGVETSRNQIAALADWSGGVAFAEADTTAFPTLRLPTTPPPAPVPETGAVPGTGAGSAIGVAAGTGGVHGARGGGRGEWRQGAVAGVLALVLGGVGMGASFYAQRSGRLHRSGVAVVQAVPPAATSGLPRFRAPRVAAAAGPVVGRLRGGGLSVARLGGRWGRGSDVWHLPGASGGVMRSGAAEYTLAVLPEGSGMESGPVAQALAARLAGTSPAIQRYAAQPLPGGINGSFAVCRVGPPSGRWRYVIVAIVTGHPGALLITIPRSAKPAFADLPRLLGSLR